MKATIKRTDKSNPYPLYTAKYVFTGSFSEVMDKVEDKLSE